MKYSILLCNILNSIYVFAIGAALGSFFNMLIYRLPREEDIVIKSSYCPKCNHKLEPIDLIPIISYLWQKGKCRYCKKHIKFRYLLTEIVCATILLFLWLKFGLSYLFFKYLLFLSSFLIIFFTDIEEYIIPDVITLPCIVIGLGMAVWEKNVLNAILGGLYGYCFFVIIAFFAKLYYKKDAIGGGDMKLAAYIGTFWGFRQIVLTTYFSFIVGGVIAVFLILIKKKKRTDYIPFAPAIIIASLFSLAFGNMVWKLYFG
jgi:leader peptidase (prepilin peptidase)/N-methyltransferase